LDEIRKIKKEGITPLELRQAVDKAIGRTALALEHSDYVSESVAESLIFYNKILTPEEELDKIKKVTLADIMQVASDIFKDENLNLALIGPFKEKEPFREILKID